MLFLCLGICIVSLACMGQASVMERTYIPGLYEGSGQGYRGEIRVRVQISPAGIEDIQILSHREAAIPGSAAMEELLDLVLIEGSTDLDTITGATFSSRGFLQAVEEALEKAIVRP